MNNTNIDTNIDHFSESEMASWNEHLDEVGPDDEVGSNEGRPDSRDDEEVLEDLLLGIIPFNWTEDPYKDPPLVQEKAHTF